MAIYRKAEIRSLLQETRDRYEKLSKLLEGQAPNPNIYNHYDEDPAQYEKDFVEIETDGLEYAISDFETALKHLKKIKNRKAKKL